ncbi:MAG: DUF1801 domain-containing protein [Alphaproteobacteria bacterium]|nr:DUF1801 domain-containing protein [Alphaproteobacteria bacterium]
MTSFIDGLPSGQKRLVNRLRKIIRDQDKAVTEAPGAIMRAKNALCYSQDDVFKYGLARTASGFTFHSMVMYANVDVLDFAKTQLKGVKVQKGCLNISSLEDFNFDAFEEMLRLSASKDFSPVIAHYQKRNRK